MYTSTSIQVKFGVSIPPIGQSSTLTSSTHPPAMMVTPTFQFNPTTGELLHFVEDDNTSVSFFISQLLEAINQPPPAFWEPIVPEIHVVLEVTNPKAPQVTSRANPPTFPKAVVTKEIPPPEAQGPAQLYKYSYFCSYFGLSISWSINSLHSLLKRAF